MLGAPGCIYLIVQDRERGIAKFGWTTGEPEARLRGLQTGNPFPLELLASWPAERSEERDLHDDFASWKAQGEWYEFGPRLWAGVEESLRRESTLGQLVDAVFLRMHREVDAHHAHQDALGAAA